MSLAQMAQTTSSLREGGQVAEQAAPPSLFRKGKKGAFQNLLAGLLGSAQGKPAAGAAGSAPTIGKDGSLATAREKSLKTQKNKAPDNQSQTQGRSALAFSALSHPSKESDAASALLARSSLRGESDADTARSGKALAKKRGEESTGQAEAIAAAMMREGDRKAIQGQAAKAGPNEGDSVESAGKSRKKKGFSIELTDLRSKPELTGSESVQKPKSPEGIQGMRERDMVIDLPSQPGTKDFKAAKAMGTAESSFSGRLAQALQDTYNQELVRNAQIILRDGDSGTIRLNLRPESLGNVKVHLDMADNKVTGKIVVESEAAREAFERNMDGLTQSFVDSGFDGAKLEVSVDSGASAGGSESRFAEAQGEGGSQTARAARYEVAASAGALDLLA